VTKKKPTKSKKVKEKTVKAAGRPSSYKEEYAQQAYKLCLLGAKDTEMANFFGVAVSTFSLWKTEHHEFSEALKSGKAQADGVIAESLFHRAKGYTHPEEKIFVYEGTPIRVDTVKHYPPDTMACIYWLNNRQPEAWRPKPQPSDGDDTVMPVKIEVTVRDASKGADAKP
jgi:hypothetical protein